MRLLPSLTPGQLNFAPVGPSHIFCGAAVRQTRADLARTQTFYGSLGVICSFVAALNFFASPFQPNELVLHGSTDNGVLGMTFPQWVRGSLNLYCSIRSLVSHLNPVRVRIRPTSHNDTKVGGPKKATKGTAP